MKLVLSKMAAMTTRVFFFFILFSFYIQCSFDSRSNEYKLVKQVESFTGENVKDSDISIQSDKDKGIISVSGNRERFIFVLPYSEDWIVKYTDNSIIQLNSHSKNLIASITTERSSNKIDQEKFLNELKNRIESRIGIKLQGTRLIPNSVSKILAYFIEVDAKGVKVKSDNYWSVRQRLDDVVLKLHFSMLNLTEEEMNKVDKSIPTFMDSGFRVLTAEDNK
ncbi:MAG: hypothetical protein IPO06_15575 [Leptospiraceae bacterium]|nr:hypothetical protein [Leptospiraceae bacterium]